MLWKGIIFWRKLLRAAFALIVLVQIVSAQYRFEVWTTDDGLPQNTVNSILQTADGYLWLATLDGLVRYDGVRFTVFNKVNSKGLNSTRIIALHEAADGALWIGTEDGGAARYFDGQFETFDGSKGLPANRVGSIFSLADARVGLLTSDGLAYWQNGKIVSADNVSRFERWIYHSCRENAATNGCNPTAWSLELPNLLKREKNGKTDVFTAPVEAEQISETPFYEDSKNALWFSLDNRLWRFADGNFSSFGEENNFRGIVTAILEDREGTLWFGTANDGVFLFKDGNFTNLTTANGLSSNLIRSIFQDRENTIWIGTDNRGLNQVQKQFITALSTNDGLGGVNVYPVLADRGGRVWIGASNSNLNVVENNQIKTFSEVRSATSLFEDRDGTLWIGAQKGLLQYANGRFTKVGADFPVPPPGGALFGTSQDRSGALWFATNKGLFRYENNNFTVYNKNNGFPDDDVRVVYEDSTGKLWVGTYEGLILFENGNFRSFTVADGLASNHIRTIYEDAEKTLWIGTYDGGLSRLKNNQLVSFTTADGLYNNGVFQILEDAQGNFWMSSNQGIHRVSRQELNEFAERRISKVSSVGYGKRDGMLNAECNGGRQPAGTKTADGRLWFPTQDGVAIVDPRLVPFNPLAPPVVIESAAVDFQAIDIQNAIRLAPGQNDLEIKFTGLSFTKPEQVRFKYRLEGLDKDWTEAGTRRSVHYSYLPPGEYVFRVTAANSDNVWNETGASIQITVVPPFYRSWWFFSLTALSIAGAVFLFYRNRIERLRRERNLAENFSRRLIESQEQERGRIAAELHDGLSQTLVIIKNRAALSLTAPENALEQLEEISTAAADAIDETREIIYDLRPVQLDRLGLIKAVEAMLRRVAESHDIHFTTGLDSVDHLFSKQTESSIYRILQESVNNIVRHSEAAEATVKIRRQTEAVEIEITDNGKGFEVEAENNGTHLNGGFGLTGIKERARLLGGEATIKSAPGVGTTIKIVIPLSDEKIFDNHR